MSGHEFVARGASKAASRSGCGRRRLVGVDQDAGVAQRSERGERGVTGTGPDGEFFEGHVGAERPGESGEQGHHVGGEFEQVEGAIDVPDARILAPPG